MPTKPMKLPPLRVLRVKEPAKKAPDPCKLAMSNVLACWAAAGFNAKGCQAVEAQLRLCMDNKVDVKPKANQINKHLSRFQKQIEGRTRSKSSRD